MLGPHHLDALLPDVLASAAARSRPTQREGALTLFQYLPLTMEAALQVGLEVGKGAVRPRHLGSSSHTGLR